MTLESRKRIALELYEWGLATFQIAPLLSLSTNQARQDLHDAGLSGTPSVKGRKVHWPRVDAVMLRIVDGEDLLEALRAEGVWLPVMADGLEVAA